MRAGVQLNPCTGGSVPELIVPASLAHFDSRQLSRPFFVLASGTLNPLALSAYPLSSALPA
jgi:hypothetical protein